jgi:hypothetical protein
MAVSGKKICVIMQPAYLPWLGYFDLIDQSQVFIFLDNVQFEKQSWQQRNRIRTPRGLEWLTVPIFIKGRSLQLIRDVEIAKSDRFPLKHWRKIEIAYRDAPYFTKYQQDLKELLLDASSMLYELNIEIIKWLTAMLEIKADFATSSALGGQGKRSSLTVDLCKKVGAEIYLSPLGAQEYLQADYQKFAQADINVWLHHYEHPVYRQLYSPFLSYASVIDLLFNEGERSLEIIRSGRRDANLQVTCYEVVR